MYIVSIRKRLTIGVAISVMFWTATLLMRELAWSGYHASTTTIVMYILFILSMVVSTYPFAMVYLLGVQHSERILHEDNRRWHRRKNEKGNSW
jgi:hypothetical protein